MVLDFLIGAYKNECSLTFLIIRIAKANNINIIIALMKFYKVINILIVVMLGLINITRKHK